MDRIQKKLLNTNAVRVDEHERVKQALRATFAQPVPEAALDQIAAAAIMLSWLDIDSMRQLAVDVIAVSVQASQAPRG